MHICAAYGIKATKSVESFRPPDIGVGGQTSLAKFLIGGPTGPLNSSIGGPLGPQASLIGGRYQPLGAIMAVGGPPVETLAANLNEFSVVRTQHMSSM
jgi:hypothetical protein